MSYKEFAKELESLLNAHSQENASSTPDFILAQYLLGCLAAWNAAVQRREEWYGRAIKQPSTIEHMTNSGEIGTGPYHPSAEK